MYPQSIPESTPVLVGVGEYSERLDDPGYQALSPVQLAVEACRAALADTGAAEAVAASLDLLAAVRTFEDTADTMASPFGRASNFPRAIARRLGVTPPRAVWSVSGGQSPQRLVLELAERIAAGEISVGLVTGGEAISTWRDLKRRGITVDWSDPTDGEVEDRGPGGVGDMTDEMLRHLLWDAPSVYGLFDNARRARLGLGEAEYRLAMGRLFAPFTQVAARHPHAMSREVYGAEQIATPGPENRMIASPYTRRLVARDQVNQSAAVVLMSVGKAKALGLDPSRWVYLHGGANADERPLHEREDLSGSPAAVMAAQAALAQAGITQAQLGFLDLYSCFPAPVYNLCDGLGIATDDPRGLTVTGGLPYFGGAGNNYALHAIATLARQLRDTPEAFGLVAANGGFLSKCSMAVYSCRPRAFNPPVYDSLKARIAALPPAPPLARQPEGAARIETFTVLYQQGEPSMAVVIARLEDSGARCFALASQQEDPETLRAFLAAEPLRHRITVQAGERHNRFRLA